eukprot:TRINITY_DN75_c0_g1_i1.p1 TRINITY_DN75_c0_g1~~TRINITY_DN75_c0_g1_i1.p1  ORF type:complete len:270 (+),score=32.90 TRINITY_DN75_c0_g1_i1:73-882(+)
MATQAGFVLLVWGFCAVVGASSSVCVSSLLQMTKGNLTQRSPQEMRENATNQSATTQDEAGFSGANGSELFWRFLSTKGLAEAIVFSQKLVAPPNHNGEQTSTTKIFGLLLSVACYGVIGLIYYYMKPFPPEKRPGTYTVVPGQWHFPLFACLEEPRLCLASCCLLPYRWADTIRMAGFLPFSQALVLCLGSLLLCSYLPLLSIVFVLLLVYYRQQLRAKFTIKSSSCGTVTEDCCTAVFCTCCLVAQEARQVEYAYQAGHPAVQSEPM